MTEKVAQIWAAGAGVNGAGQVIEPLTRAISTLNPSSPEFQQRKEEINNQFDQIDNFREQLKTLLG